MSVPLIVNGVTFNYPVQGDTNWGPVLTAWSTAVTNALSIISGGNASFLTITSQSSNPATAGFLRLANTDAIEWRNFANSGNLALAVNASNQLTFNGVPIGAAAALTNGHIFVGNVSNQPADVAMSGDITITNTGVTAIGAGIIVNADINAAAAIARSKLAVGTAGRLVYNDGTGVLSDYPALSTGLVLVTDPSGLPVTATPTTTEINYVSGVTSSIQTQINAISPYVVPTGSIIDFAGTVAPTGWLVCDGSFVLKATYAALFAAIGTNWGPSDATQFTIPNMTRRVGVGSGGTGTGTLANGVGATGGEETHTLTTPEIPSHTHAPTDPGHTHTETGTTAAGATSSLLLTAGRDTASAANASISTLSNTTGITIGNTGGGGSHNNIQPSAVVLKIIKT